MFYLEGKNGWKRFMIYVSLQCEASRKIGSSLLFRMGNLLVCNCKRESDKTQIETNRSYFPKGSFGVEV